MKTLYYTYIQLILMSSMICYSCSDEINLPVVVHQDLEVHFANFEFEGQNRGLDVDLMSEEIQGFMNDINQTGVVGQCIHSQTDGKSIVIDSDRWRRLTAMEKEFIVFHELGHCYLDRGHTDDAANDGTCLSMMHSSSEACHNIYNATTRKDYLDELFLN